MELLENIDALVSTPFASLEDLLAFYREHLPKRVKNYHQEEVGPIMHKDLPGEADKFVKKIFHLGEETLDMSDGLNWYGSPSGDLEWNGGLVRHGYFMLLADEYKKTGNEIYAQTIVEHILDYIENVPRFAPVGKPYLEYKKSTWRPFEVACRVAETWPEALAKIINSEHVTPEAWGKIFYSIYDHADFLTIHHWKTGNHATLEVADLGIISIFYKEFKRADEWRKYAVDFLMDMWPKLFHEDGYTKEMSGGYHWVAMRSYFSFYEVALNNGYESIFSAEYEERLILNAMAELYQDKPDYSIPVTNDSNTKTNRKEQLERIHALFKLPEVEYRLTEGKSGKAPEHTSYFFPVARVGIMRSDWTQQARYLFFDMGRWGENHMNEDQLNIEVFAYGRPFLTNCGRWRYTTSPDAPWMSWARYFKTTRSYNSVLIDGYNQVNGDADGFMNAYDNYDYAEGWFDAGYGVDVSAIDEKELKEKGITQKKTCRVSGVEHTRKIIFVKPVFWIVRDEVTGSGGYKAEQIWHYYDGNLNKEGNVWVTQFDDANLIVQTIGKNDIKATYYKGSEDPIAGWHCPYYDIKRPAPELRFEQKGIDSIIFHTLIFPIKGKPETLPQFEVTNNGYKVSFGSTEWTVIYKLNGFVAILVKES